MTTPPILPERFNSISAPKMTTIGPSRSDVLEDAVVEILARCRDPHVRAWPEDERQAYRDGSALSFTTGQQHVDRLRARKLIHLIRSAAWTNLPAAATVLFEDEDPS